MQQNERLPLTLTLTQHHTIISAGRFCLRMLG